MPTTALEKRIFKLADALLPRLKKKKSLAVRGGTWEVGYDFAKTPRLVWQFNAHRRDRYIAVIPKAKEVIGIGALRLGYVERKLREAAETLGTNKAGRRARGARRAS